ncbi:cutinase family protein [Candidatus Saccharibacteria bacterium]|nr:cutinase family protein [Candidatus Saccharibacteria bacterium]
MRKALTALPVASIVAFAVGCTPLATPTSASSCDDVQFIFARGSGQELNEMEYRFFESHITNNIKLTLPELKYSFYELGSKSIDNYQYPAVDLGFVSAITATISGGSAFKFGKSVNQGINELQSYIKEVSSVCHNTKFVLGGYSQGAMVVTETLPSLNPNKIIYAANFGDPKLYLPEGRGLFPDACRGANFSTYRVYAPNCRTSAGFLGAKKPYAASDWADKISIWCNNKDFVCGAGITLEEPFSTHVKYATDGHIQSAANIIGKKLIDTFATKYNISSDSAKKQITGYGNRDTVFLLDTTVSMKNSLKKGIDDIRRSAKVLMDGGGRVALWTYGDLLEVEPTQIIDFTSDYEQFEKVLDIDTLPHSNGGDGRESAYSAFITVMNTQNWRNGAIKSIVLITDAPPLQIDRDETRVEDVIRRSLEIDPVNLYTIGLPHRVEHSYDNLIYNTSGENYGNLPEDLSTSSLVNRPNIYMTLEQYIASPGETITYSIVGDTDDYESITWDLDLDGFYETNSNQLEMSVSYDTELDSYVQAKIDYKNGMRASASAHVVITNTANREPSLAIKNVLVENQDATIDVSYGENTIGAIVAINGAPVGIIYDNSLSFSDLTPNVIVSLTPFSDSGTTGTPIEQELSTIGRGQATAPQNNIPAPDNETIDGWQASNTNKEGMMDSLRKIILYTNLRAPNSGRK